MNDPASPNGKPPLSRLPDVLEDGAAVMERGAKKRTPNDWREKNYAISLFTDAGERHVQAYKRGQDNDPESGQPHLVHAFVNFMMAHELQRDGLGVDDRWRRSAAVKMGVDFGTVPPKTAVFFDEAHEWGPEFKFPAFETPRIWQWRKWRRYRTAESRFWMATTATPPPRWWQFWRRSK